MGIQGRRPRKWAVLAAMTEPGEGLANGTSAVGSKFCQP